MKMRKKILALLLVSTLAVGVCACGSSSSSDTKEESSVTEVADESTVSESSEAEEVNEYGMTDSETAELVTIVKTKITEGYLDKYSIAPSDFVLSKSNQDVYSRYYSEHEYSGDDAYGCTSMWVGVNGLLVNPSIEWMNYNFLNMLTEGSDKEMRREMAIESIAENWNSEESVSFMLKESMDEQAAAQPLNYWFMDSSEQALDLDRCVYEGIAEFLNNMDKTRAAEIIADQYLLCDAERMEIEVSDSHMSMSMFTHMMFENVICDNISFE